jgi:lipoprotein-anchoring transpeptidase ErfK/SrfK
MAPNSASKNKKSSPGLLLAIFLSALMVVLTICVAFTVSPSVASALAGSPSPTGQPLSWSVAVIAKPTHTPSPVSAFTTVPTNIPVRASSATKVPPPLKMNLVSDTSATTSDSQDNSVGKYFLVSISQQHLYAYDNGQLVYSFIASTGMGNSTRVGTFSVLDKIPNAYGATWNIWMPDWLGIYWSGSLENGIHALPILADGNRLWAGFLGTPISFGCVVLGVDNSLQLYNWADIGTPVEIQR